MSNPLRKSMNTQNAGLGTGINGGMNNPFGMFMSRFNEFQQFAKGMNPNEAKERVQQMLFSGQMTKEQFDQFSALARQFQGMLGGNRK